MLQMYPNLKVGRQLCHPHYCSIIEADRSQRRKKLKQKKVAIRKKKVLEPIEPSNNNDISKYNSIFNYNITFLIYIYILI